MLRLPYVKYSTGTNIATPHGVSCDAETRFYGRPQGRSVYGKRNGNTHNVTTWFSARKRYFVLQRPFLPYLFPQEGKDMVAEGTVRCRRKNGTSGESGESLPRPPDAVPSAHFVRGEIVTLRGTDPSPKTAETPSAAQYPSETAPRRPIRTADIFLRIRCKSPAFPSGCG